MVEVEENLLRMILEKESWEEIIYFIVSKERLDPWNIDLIKLTDSFIRFIREAKELDFRIPAKVVFVAALLLRMKSEYLFEVEKEEEIKKEEKEIFKIDLEIGKLTLPLKRFPKRQVTLEELIKALRKALEVKEKKEIRRRMYERRRFELRFEEEDISLRLEKLLKEIDELFKKSQTHKIAFKELVGEWKREKIIEKFIPLLHLDQDKKVKTEQKELFDEIWISKI